MKTNGEVSLNVNARKRMNDCLPQGALASPMRHPGERKCDDACISVVIITCLYVDFLTVVMLLMLLLLLILVGQYKKKIFALDLIS